MTASFSRLPSLSFIGICVAAAASFSAAVAARASESWQAGVDLFRRAVAFAFDVLARPEPMLAGNGGFTGLLVGHRRTYDVPPIHSLRHEAGTPRRAADRHI
jgi:hypothetical protein